MDEQARVHADAAIGIKLARLLAGDAPAGAVPVSCVRRTPRCTVLRVQVGSLVVAAKAFGAGLAGSAAAFDREVAVLGTLQDTGLCPDLLLANKSELLIATRWVDAPNMAALAAPGSIVALSRALGQWYARYVPSVPRVAARTDWLEYLSNYSEFSRDSLSPGDRDFLAGLPIRTMGIAKNDAVLSNFLVPAANRLCGVDFADATMRPIGWDNLLNARMLMKTFPNTARAVTDALVQGWGQGTESVDAQALSRLAGLFARTALAAQASRRD